MSRIGKLPIILLEKVHAKINGNSIFIEGPKGKLSFSFSDVVQVEHQENTIIVSPRSDAAKALWGTTRSIINNMVIGVSEGYTKSLEINGVGYKMEPQGQKLIMSIGFSHKIEVIIPEGLQVSPDASLKNVIHMTGIDKQLLGEFASKIRGMKKPEPYKGKGIKYVGEQIRRKAGKTGSK